MLYNIEDGYGPPASGIGGAENQKGNPCQHDGPRAHGARFLGDVEGGIDEPPVPQRGGRLCDGDHLRMGRGVLQTLDLVMGPADNPRTIALAGSLVHNHATGWHLAVRLCKFSFPQG